ncbi:MAG: S9 family peptidase [Thermoanaerobaculia bacterium]|nr:S9 family peptidase [Thermoanaerobaculia bacterium]
MAAITRRDVRHFYLPLILASLLLTGCPGGDSASDVDSSAEAETVLTDVPRYPIGAFLDVTAYGGGGFSPDGTKLLVHHDRSGIYNAYALAVDGSGETQLTQQTDESIFVSGYFPEDERFVYVSDSGGNELYHVFVQETDGSVTDLTPGDEHRATFGGWTWDESAMIVLTNERDPKFMDAYLVDPSDYSRELVFENQGYQFSDLSPDKSRVLLAQTLGNADTDVLVQDLASGERTTLSLEGESSDRPLSFSADGEWVYYTTDRDSEFSYLAKVRPDGTDRQEVARFDWDVMWAYLSRSGKHLVVAVNEDARTRLHLYDATTLDELALPELSDAQVTSVGFSRDETKISLFASTDRTPGDLYVAELRGGEAPRRLTRSLSAEIDPEHLVSGEVVRFESFDGVEIPGVLYKPHQANADGAKLPALVSVHGGPGGQSRVGYRDLTQYLVNHGYVVYAINNRGSSGYGKTFFHMDDLDHGGGDLQDCVASKQMLIDTGYVDPERIGIIGGSYGGFMVLAALTFEPEAFDVGVDIFGVSNWVRTLQNIPPWWEAARKMFEQEMGKADDEEFLRSFSPLFHAENIIRPLMVLQGANDPRVLQAESDEIVAAARANGVPVEYLVFEDEGHGFVKRENQEAGYRGIREFLDRYLKESDPTSAPSPSPAAP